MGIWLVGIRRSMFDAIIDMNAHGHAEVFVVRCSLEDSACGPD
jgi:hypothetical protein